MKIKLKLKSIKGTPVPQCAYQGDAGIDLTVMEVLPQRKRVFLLDMGLSIELEPGYYAELHCRSGIYKTDFIMVNSVGIIDSGYRGNIYMPVRYLGEGTGDDEAKELIGKRFGQLILRRLIEVNLVHTEKLSPSSRDMKGLGSSG